MTNDVQIAIRLPKDSLAKVDDLAEALSARMPVRVSRAAVLRMLVDAHVDEHLKKARRARRTP